MTNLRPKLWLALVVIFAFFVAVSAGYTAGNLVLAFGLDTDWAIVAFGLVFAFVILIFDKARLVDSE